MTDPMTQERLDAIKARCEAATLGPWYVEYEMDGPFAEPQCIQGPENVTTYHDAYNDYRVSAVVEMAEADLEFIAHARQDIPDLLAEVERLRAENDRLNSAMHRIILRSAE